MPVSQKPRHPKPRSTPAPRVPADPAANPLGFREFTAPSGTVAITLDINGAQPTTCMIDATKLTDALADIETEASKHSYDDLVRIVAREFPPAKADHDDRVIEWLGLLALWTAFNTPTAPQMRTAVASLMRRNEVTHITWHVGSNGLAIALSNSFVDLAEIALAAPKDSLVVRARKQAAEVQH